MSLALCENNVRCKKRPDVLLASLRINRLGRCTLGLIVPTSSPAEEKSRQQQVCKADVCSTNPLFR